MAFRRLFTSKSPPRTEITSPPASPVTLVRAPAYQPLLIDTADAVDAEVVRLWADYQRRHGPSSWSSFLDDLRISNAEMSQRLERLESNLSHYQSREVFQP